MLGFEFTQDAIDPSIEDSRAERADFRKGQHQAPVFSLAREEPKCGLDVERGCVERTNHLCAGNPHLLSQLGTDIELVVHHCFLNHGRTPFRLAVDAA